MYVRCRREIVCRGSPTKHVFNFVFGGEAPGHSRERLEIGIENRGEKKTSQHHNIVTSSLPYPW